MAEFKHLDFDIDPEKEEEVHKIMAELRPDWQKDKITTKREHMTGQLARTMVDVTHGSDRKGGLRVRVDGPMSAELGLSRSREISFLRHVNSRGVGVALVASFNNGLVTELPPGGPCEDESLMKNPDFAKRVARVLAELHVAAPPDADPTARDGSKSGTFAMANVCLKVLRTLTEESVVKQFLKSGVTLDEIESELKSLYSELETLGAPVGLAHNAIWSNSIIHDPDSDTISITDYEMMDINFQPFDLASYLICVTGIPMSQSQRSSLSSKFSRDLIRAYLERRLELEGKSRDSLTEPEVERYYVWTCKCCLLHLLFNVPNGLYIAYHRVKDTNIEMDFTDFVMSFYKEYKAQKEEYSSLELPE